MPAGSRTPTLQEVFDRHGEAVAAGLRVSMPGQVTKYHPAQGLVDVQPLLKDGHLDDTGTWVPDTLPVIYSCPLIFPGSGGFVVTFPVSVGDQVLLIFTDRALDQWLGKGGLVDPGIDPRRHHLTDAIAIAGLNFKAWQNANANQDHLCLGQDGGSFHLHIKGNVVQVGDSPTDAAALASKTDARLTALETFAAGHTHPYAWTGSPGTASTSPAPGAPVGSSTASSHLKVDE